MNRQQTDYTPRPEIARLKSFNSDEGFYYYHVKWAIGNLKMGSGLIHSKFFKTIVLDEYSRDCDQEWQLRFFLTGEEYTTTCVNLLRSINKGDDDEIPVIARVKVMNETKHTIEFSSSTAFLLADSDFFNNHSWDIPEEDAKNLSKYDRYTIHCWMDIPKSYKGWQNGGHISGPALLSSSLARSFEKVTRKNADPTSDIELVIKNGSVDPPRFYCHQLILASRSPVFEMMFTNDRFKESKERIVEIEDMDGKTLKLLLRYLYTGKIPEPFVYDDTPKELIHSLLNAAEKYMLPELKDECALALIGGGKKNCDDGEWIEHLQLAETFGFDYLKKVCLLALSTNMRSLREQNIREKVSPPIMAELLDLVTKRGEIIQTIEVKSA